MRNVLTYFSIKYKGDWEKVYKAIDEKERINKSDVDNFVSNVNENKITLLDDDYPNGLKYIYKPPFVLFYKGNKKLINNKHFLLSLMDDEINSDYIRTMGNDLCEVVVVVDYSNKKVIKELIENKIKFIAISKKGIVNIKTDQIYQDIINNNNLIISESYEYDGTDRDFFFDRLLVGISRKTLFTNSIQKHRYPLLSILVEESIPIYSLKERKINSSKLIKIKSLKEFKKISLFN